MNARGRCNGEILPLIIYPRGWIGDMDWPIYAPSPLSSSGKTVTNRLRASTWSNPAALAWDIASASTCDTNPTTVPLVRRRHSAAARIAPGRFKSAIINKESMFSNFAIADGSRITLTFAPRREPPQESVPKTSGRAPAPKSGEDHLRAFTSSSRPVGHVV